MPRPTGQRLPAEQRRQGIEAVASLIAAGVADAEATRQVAQRYDVSKRTAQKWLKRAYADLAGEAEQDRRNLLGVALRRRRIAMSRAAKNGDWKTYLAACDSEARLLGLEKPRQTEHRVLIERTGEMARLIAETVRDELSHDPALRQRFIRALQERIGRALSTKPQALALVIDAEEPALINSGSDSSS